MPYETPAELAALIVETMARVDTVMDEVELLRVKGSVASVGALPAGASAGDAYVVETGPSAGHLFGWVTTAWIDFGKFQGEQGVQGQKGWSPILQVVADGARRVLRITDWDGGAGAKPATGGYLGPSGIVVDIADAADVRGSQGVQGQKGWSPVLEVVTDGARRVLRIADWAGGEGTKPASGQYLGAAGLVTDVADAADVRGAIGATGPAAWAAPVAWTTLTAFTASAPRSVVTQGGRSYACLVSHTSGTFSTDLAAGRWIMVADKGTDGTGTGTVQHTGSPAAGQLARFADASGDLIEGVAATKSLVGLGNVDNTADLAKPISTAVQAALDLKINIADAASQADLLGNQIRIFAQLAEIRGNQFGTPYGFADDFSDTDGWSSLTGCAINTTSKRLISTGGTAALLTGNTSNADGSTASASSEYTSDYQAWAAFNGVVTGEGGNARWVAASADSGWLRRQWPAGKTFNKYSIRAQDDTGGNKVNDIKSWTLRGSNNGTSWTTLDTRTNVAAWGVAEVREFTIASPASYTYYELNITAVQTSGQKPGVPELTFTETPPALVAISAGFGAAAAPTKASVFLVLKASVSFTLNTDLVASVSRDNGATWTAVTLAARESVGGGYVAYEALAKDISAQPSGTTLKLKIDGAVSKEWDVTTAALLWGGP